ncbi:hypothetical protein Sste5346_008108 [Sporothrix stenoceras]|uniref:FAD dependent oxidoreductase domain-containing protein n=1 Tax=Sporothrix stenoceras TaxID=5173 RepID=A0ABR3YQY7_9PEZI
MASTGLTESLVPVPKEDGIASLAGRYTVYTTHDELEARNCSPHVVGAIGIPAGTCWSCKLVTHFFDAMLKEHKNLNIQTMTRVTAVQDSGGDSTEIAIVQTDRGDIRARHIVHATNCWVGNLLPELGHLCHPSAQTCNVKCQKQFMALTVRCLRSGLYRIRSGSAT